MKGTCKLCQQESQLKKSHFIPKFVGRWIKKTGITGYLREHNDVSKRVQDTAKEYWLCRECEGLFSDWERQFADNVFYPFVDKEESEAEYTNWLPKFSASLTWRTLTLMRNDNQESEHPEDYLKALELAESHLRAYLLGEKDNLDQYEQHIFPLLRINSTIKTGLPPNINRYFLRTMALDIVGNSSSLYVYTKLPSFIVLGVIYSKETNKIRSSRLALKQGKLSPRKHRFPDGFTNYIVEKATEIDEAYKSIPEHHKKSFEDYISKNPEKTANSKLFEAFTYDYEQFGDKVFR